MNKKIVILLNFILMMIPTIVFAEDGSYGAVSSVSQTVLNILSWVGYIIAFGMLMWIGIKYMISSADEKANLKGTFKNYIIGLVLILLCSTVAAFVANVSDGTGDNSGEGIIDTGFELGGLVAGSGELGSDGEDLNGDDESEDIVEMPTSSGDTADSGDVDTPSGDETEETAGGTIMQTEIVAPLEVNGKKFLYWEVYKLDEEGNRIGEPTIVEGNVFSLEPYIGKETEYDFVPVYEEKELTLDNNDYTTVLGPEWDGDYFDPILDYYEENSMSFYIGVDTAATLLQEECEALKAMGYQFAGRYLVPARYGKAILRDEAEIICSAGLRVLTVFEIDTDDWQSGATNGYTYAKWAYECAQDLEMPADGIIYFAVDTGVGSGQMHLVIEYLQACRETIASLSASTGGPNYGIGVYGNYYVVEACAEAGVCDAYWQCVGGSGGNISDYHSVYQACGTTRIGLPGRNVAVDLNTCPDMEAAGLWTYYPELANATSSTASGLMPGTEPTIEAMDDETFEILIEEAEKYLGYPYVWGGSTPETSFDCSGFVCWVYKNSGVYPLYRATAQGIYNQCEVIAPEYAKPGDIVFFTKTYETTDTVTHVGIYVGNDRMIHCGNPISYITITGSHYEDHFYAFGRLDTHNE